METIKKRIVIAIGAVPAERKWHGRKAAVIVVALVVGACLGASLWKASTPEGAEDGFEVRTDSQAPSMCAAKEAPAECTASSFWHLAYVMPDRVAKVFPANGI